MAPTDIRPQGYFPQGSFIIPTTAIERRRRLAQELAKTGGSGPVQSWTQGAARLAGALGSVLEEGRANQMEQQRGSALAEALRSGTPEALINSGVPELQQAGQFKLQQQQQQAQNEHQAAQDAERRRQFELEFGLKKQAADQPDYGFAGGQFYDQHNPQGGAQPIPGFHPAQEPAKASDVLPVIKDYNNQPGVSGYRAINPMLHSMHKSLSDPSAVADLDFVYGVAKVMDPQSVVRESEQGTIIASQSIPQSLLGQLNKFMTGQQVLSPDVRRQLYNVARRRGAEMQAQGETERKFYLGFGQKYGIGEDQLRPLEPLPPEAEAPPPATAPPPAGAMAAPAGTSVHKNIPFRIMP